MFDIIVGLSNIGSFGLQVVALVSGESLERKAEIPVAILNEAHSDTEKAMSVLMKDYGLLEDKIVQQYIDKYKE
jgi:hypothetical protein